MCGKLKEMQKDNTLSNIRIKTNNCKDNRELESVSKSNILRQSTHQ